MQHTDPELTITHVSISCIFSTCSLFLACCRSFHSLQTADAFRLKWQPVNTVSQCSGFNISVQMSEYQRLHFLKKNYLCESSVIKYNIWHIRISTLIQTTWFALEPELLPDLLLEKINQHRLIESDSRIQQRCSINTFQTRNFSRYFDIYQLPLHRAVQYNNEKYNSTEVYFLLINNNDEIKKLFFFFL